MSQYEWNLYESGHKFFIKASQILYSVGDPNLIAED